MGNLAIPPLISWTETEHPLLCDELAPADRNGTFVVDSFLPTYHVGNPTP